MSITLDGSLGITSPSATVPNTFNSSSTFGFKSRIINGNMAIDQRNAGASSNALSGICSLDRWNTQCSINSKFTIQQNAGAVSPPAGFANYLGCTSSSAYSVPAGEYFVIQQKIEGFNFADMAWGTASASSVTLSFWVRSSLTGTFGGCLRNSAADRSYPFTYTISVANTWEQKTITIAGDTSGTWVGATNGIGTNVTFSLGAGSTFSGTAGAWANAFYFSATGATSVVGTNGATFYITGVQLEKGSTATSFDYRPYGTELALCQRYYYKQQAVGTSNLWGGGFNNSTTVAVLNTTFPVEMRSSPTALEQSGTATQYQVYASGGNVVCSAVPVFNFGNIWGGSYTFTVASGLTAGQSSLARSNSASAYLGWSAEL